MLRATSKPSAAVHGLYFLELVAHPSYVVILEQALNTVTVLEVLHSAMRYP